MKTIYKILVLLFTLSFFSCEDVVDINSKKKFFSMVDFWFRYIDLKSVSHLKTWMAGKSCNDKYSEIQRQTIDGFSKISMEISK